MANCFGKWGRPAGSLKGQVEWESKKVEATQAERTYSYSGFRDTAPLRQPKRKQIDARMNRL
jgi:hypothetical protein